jgi:hypothetical protein
VVTVPAVVAKSTDALTLAKLASSWLAGTFPEALAKVNGTVDNFYPCYF